MRDILVHMSPHQPAPRIFGFWSFVVLLASLILACAARSAVFADVELLYFSYSTIVQGFLALVGFLGAVALFRLQLFETHAAAVADSVKDKVGELSKSARIFTWRDVMFECEMLYRDSSHKEHPHLHHITEGLTVFRNLENRIDSIKKLMLGFSLLSLLAVVVSLIGLPLSKFLIGAGHLTLNAFYVAITFSLAFEATRAAYLILKSAVGQIRK